MFLNNDTLPEYIIEKADRVPEKYKKQFNCGNDYLNGYLLGNDNHNTVTYVWMDNKEMTVIAYASISCSGLVHDLGNNKIRVHSAIQIDCFAVDLKYQNFYIDINNEKLLISGDILNYLIYDIICNISENYCNAEFAILLSVPESVSFYTYNGFRVYEDFFVCPSSFETQGCIPMYLVL